MSSNRKEVLIILCRKVGYFLRDTVQFSRKNWFRVYKSILRERLFAFAAIGLYLILCCNNYGLYFTPTRTLGGFIQLFPALREPLLLLASHPARKPLENWVPKTVFVHVFSCECVCLCVKIKGETEFVGYQSDTSLL